MPHLEDSFGTLEEWVKISESDIFSAESEIVIWTACQEEQDRWVEDSM